jgi:hypothetical protein
MMGLHNIRTVRLDKIEYRDLVEYELDGFSLFYDKQTHGLFARWEDEDGDCETPITSEADIAPPVYVSNIANFVSLLKQKGYGVSFDFEKVGS